VSFPPYSPRQHWVPYIYRPSILLLFLEPLLCDPTCRRLSNPPPPHLLFTPGARLLHGIYAKTSPFLSAVFFFASGRAKRAGLFEKSLPLTQSVAFLPLFTSHPHIFDPLRRCRGLCRTHLADWTSAILFSAFCESQPSRFFQISSCLESKSEGCRGFPVWSIPFRRRGIDGSIRGIGTPPDFSLFLKISLDRQSSRPSHVAGEEQRILRQRFSPRWSRGPPRSLI